MSCVILKHFIGKKKQKSILSLLLGSRTSEMIEIDVEPLVDALVNGVVLVTDLPRRQTLLNSLQTLAFRKKKKVQSDCLSILLFSQKLLL